jgi:hypothetical protein
MLRVPDRIAQVKPSRRSDPAPIAIQKAKKKTIAIHQTKALLCLASRVGFCLA